MLQSEQIPKHERHTFPYFFRYKHLKHILKIGLAFVFCVSLFLGTVLHCPTRNQKKSWIRVVGRTFQNKPRLNWGPLCYKFVFQFCTSSRSEQWNSLGGRNWKGWGGWFWFVWGRKSWECRIVFFFFLWFFFFFSFRWRSPVWT